MDLIDSKVNYVDLPFRQFIDENIYGRLTMPDIDCQILMTAVAMCMGDHIEIGVAHGGSLIAAAYAKKMTKAEGDVYGIDPLEGYKGDRTPTPPNPLYEYVWRNVELHQMEDRIKLFKGWHPPLPAEIRNKKFASAFIDGGHDFKSVADDWEGLKNKVEGIILFHDVNNPAFGSGTVYEIAKSTGEWTEIHKEGKMGVLIKDGYKFRTIEEISDAFYGSG